MTVSAKLSPFLCTLYESMKNRIGTSKMNSGIHKKRCRFLKPASIGSLFFDNNAGSTGKTFVCEKFHHDLIEHNDAGDTKNIRIIR